VSAPLCFFDSRASVLIRAAARNIVTHHAEDGSGMGAALIAGESY
jgi:hexokinase